MNCLGRSRRYNCEQAIQRRYKYQIGNSENSLNSTKTKTQIKLYNYLIHLLLSVSDADRPHYNKNGFSKSNFFAVE